MTAPVFYAPTVTVNGCLTSLQNGAVDGGKLTLEGEEGHHASKVQRLRVGERVDLVDGEGFRVASVVASEPQTSSLEVEVVGVVQELPSNPEVTLVQGLAKNGRDEQAIEMATELGVDFVIPWQAERSIVRWGTKKGGGSSARWHRILKAAMKQSRRSFCPQLECAVTSSKLANTIEKEISEGTLVLVCHQDATQPIVEALRQFDVSSCPKVMIVVGPEGGITDFEMNTLVISGAKPVSLGKNVLRSSTSGPAALVAVNFETGRC